MTIKVLKIDFLDGTRRSCSWLPRRSRCPASRYPPGLYRGSCWSDQCYVLLARGNSVAVYLASTAACGTSGYQGLR